jgi:hypothetical protein
MKKLVLILAAASSAAFAAHSKTPTFSQDVAPILFNHCVNCHRPGEVAPFSLTTYADAKKWAGVIATVTHKRYMPPWKAEPGYNQFRDVRALSNAELATLDAWAKAGAPEGDAKKTPPLPKFPEGWQLGTPDLVITMPATYQVPADGEDLYECFVIPMELTQDLPIAAVEVRPGNRRVLHHTLLYADNSRAGRDKAAAESGKSYKCYGGPGLPRPDLVAGWAPGMTPRRLPDGMAKVVSKGADLVMQNHYHPTGKAESDATTIGIYYQKGPITTHVYSLPLLQRDLNIPAGEKRYRTTVAFTTPMEIEIASVAPHMHQLGREMKVWATLPSGEVKPIIWIKDWDFNWQNSYAFADPMALPKGTKIEVEAFFDNSAENPRNPSKPPQNVTWGEATTEEMCIAFLGIQTKRPSDRMAMMMSLGQQLQLFKYPDLMGTPTKTKTSADKPTSHQ